MEYINITEACKILGVNNSASDDEIQKRWRIVARKYHPDLNPGNANAKKEFKKYRDAYEVLNTFNSGSRALSALVDEAIDMNFDDWLDDLDDDDERKIEMKKELEKFGLDE